MKTAGIRAARQHLSQLLDSVSEGHEVVITDRGRPVARLVAPEAQKAQRYQSRRALRRSIHAAGLDLSAAIHEDREDRS